MAEDYKREGQGLRRGLVQRDKTTLEGAVNFKEGLLLEVASNWRCALGSLSQKQPSKKATGPLMGEDDLACKC